MAKANDDESTNGRKDVYRMSVTIDPSVRKRIRIAAAINDLEVGEWAADVLNKAAAQQLKEARTNA